MHPSAVSSSSFKRKELEQAHRLLENDQNIDIAVRRIIAAGDRSKDTGVLRAVTFKGRDSFLPDFVEGHALSIRRRAGFDKCSVSDR